MAPKRKPIKRNSDPNSIFYQPHMQFSDLDQTQKLVWNLLDREVNDNWVLDCKAFLEFRIPKLLTEIELLKQNLGHPQ
jgi:hypothetical protein